MMLKAQILSLDSLLLKKFFLISMDVWILLYVVFWLSGCNLCLFQFNEKKNNEKEHICHEFVSRAYSQYFFFLVFQKEENRCLFSKISLFHLILSNLAIKNHPLFISLSVANFE